MLGPEVFGLFAIVYAIISFTHSIIEGGFGQYLIISKQPSNKDYSTLFYCNLLLAFIFYVGFYFLSGMFARYFNEPLLKPMIKIVGLNLFLYSLAIVQRVILVRNLDFKKLALISTIASIISGFIGIGLAYCNKGVWSLIYKNLFSYLITAIMLWSFSNWKPVIAFSKDTFLNMYNYGKRLILATIIRNAYENIYNIIIGKLFSFELLGNYNQAKQFNNLASRNLEDVIRKVSFPTLSRIFNAETANKFKLIYRNVIKTTSFIVFNLLALMAALAKPLILTLLGEEWQETIILLQILVIEGMMFSLRSVIINLLKIIQRTDIILKTEVRVKIIAIPIILIGTLYGIYGVVIATVVIALFDYLLLAYKSSKLINYTTQQQIADIIPALISSILIFSIIYLLDMLSNLSPKVSLFSFGLLGILFIISSAIITKQHYLLYMLKYLSRKA